MRVISGSARGSKLSAPAGMSTRPTADRIKESFFNMISGDLHNCRFLDLFSGSGAIGIEALSRGAKQAVFVDSANESIKIINQNIEKTKLTDCVQVIKSDAVSAIKRLDAAKQKFDIIFMDPPYGKGLVAETLNAIAKSEILGISGFIAAEQGADEPIPETQGYSIYKTKQYSTTTILFLQIQNAE